MCWGDHMLEISRLYRPYKLKQQYQGIQEVCILESIYTLREGTLEKIIAQKINEAVVEHMSLDISSTIMQVLELNKYLSGLFMDNLGNLIYNYCLNYLLSQGISEIDEVEEERISALVKAVHLKTDLSVLNSILDKKEPCDV